MRWLVLALLPLLTTPAIACEGDIEAASVYLMGKKLANGGEVLDLCSGTYEDGDAYISCYD